MIVEPIISHKAGIRRLHSKCNKRRTYCLFKNKCGIGVFIAPYPFPRTRGYVHIRCGVAPLRIETGPYHNVPLSHRLCQLCNINQTENKTHVMLNCSIIQRKETLNHHFGDLFVNLPHTNFYLSLQISLELEDKT